MLLFLIIKRKRETKLKVIFLCKTNYKLDFFQSF
nr:MAG TPA: hypothetical protein [Caudoviricetes sp.]